MGLSHYVNGVVEESIFKRCQCCWIIQLARSWVECRFCAIRSQSSPLKDSFPLTQTLALGSTPTPLQRNPVGSNIAVGQFSQNTARLVSTPICGRHSEVSSFPSKRNIYCVSACVEFVWTSCIQGPMKDRRRHRIPGATIGGACEPPDVGERNPLHSPCNQEALRSAESPPHHPLETSWAVDTCLVKVRSRQDCWLPWFRSFLPVSLWRLRCDYIDLLCFSQRLWMVCLPLYETGG